MFFVALLIPGLVDGLSTMPMSASVPFLRAPAKLEGYVGAETEFDPLGFSDKQCRNQAGISILRDLIFIF